MEKWEYRPAALSELNRLWEKNIARNPGDDRWPVWRDGNLARNASGDMQSFAAILDGEPVGEGTLIFSPECSQIGGRTDLADGTQIANVNGLRIEKAYEGNGHISKMMRAMEEEARRRGYSVLTIGVDACEARNLAIYLHWGYRRLIRHEIEDGELVLYYAKDLISL